jgi:hypothetical protein
VERLDLLAGDGGHAGDLLVERGRVARIARRVRIAALRRSARLAICCGSVRVASSPVTRSRLSLSSSSAGNAGSRATSASSRSVSGSSLPNVRPVIATLVSPPRTSTLARSRSSVSSISCRERFALPRSSIDAVMAPAGWVPKTDFSSP